MDRLAVKEEFESQGCGKISRGAKGGGAILDLKPSGTNFPPSPAKSGAVKIEVARKFPIPVHDERTLPFVQNLLTGRTVLVQRNSSGNLKTEYRSLLALRNE